MRKFILILGLLLPAISFAQSYPVAWYKISGGGGTGTGGSYQVSDPNSITLTPPVGNLFFRLEQ